MIIWNTDDVILDDVNPVTGEPSSDIYVKRSGGNEREARAWLPYSLPWPMCSLASLNLCSSLPWCEVPTPVLCMGCCNPRDVVQVLLWVGSFLLPHEVQCFHPSALPLRLADEGRGVTEFLLQLDKRS